MSIGHRREILRRFQELALRPREEGLMLESSIQEPPYGFQFTL